MTDQTQHQAQDDDRRRSSKEVQQAQAQRDYDEITYIPTENGDPIATVVGGDPSRPETGIRFTANKPVRVPKHTTIGQLIGVDKEAPDGSIVKQFREVRMKVSEVLRNNPGFSINGAPPPKRVQAHASLPSDPNQYRSYAIRWISGATDAMSLEMRWKQEDNLRNRCGVNDHDLSFISPFYEARLMELRGAQRLEMA